MLAVRRNTFCPESTLLTKCAKRTKNPTISMFFTWTTLLRKSSVTTTTLLLRTAMKTSAFSTSSQTNNLPHSLPKNNIGTLLCGQCPSCTENQRGYTWNSRAKWWQPTPTQAFCNNFCKIDGRLISDFFGNSRYFYQTRHFALFGSPQATTEDSHEHLYENCH